MVSIDEIKLSVNKIISKYPLKRIALFGSYATNEQNEDSDVDFLVEFTSPSISLFTIAALKYDLQDMLNIPVDVIHSPIGAESIIMPKKEVDIFVKS